MPDNRDAAAAMLAVGEFWQSLVDEDDLTALRFTSELVHQELGTGPGYAVRVRDALALDGDQIGRVATSAMVRVVNGQMVFLCPLLQPGEAAGVLGSWGPVQVPARRMTVVLESGRWVVNGQYQSLEPGLPPGTDYIDLAAMTDGPTQ